MSSRISADRPPLSWAFLTIRALLLPLAFLVPSEMRREWRQEWRAELASLPEARDPSPLAGLRLFAIASGAVTDALCLLFDDWSFDTMFQDLRDAFRALWRRPSTTLLAVMVLALGIGASTAVFSVVDRILLQPLPYEDPERLVEIWEKNPEKGWDRNICAAANYWDWREQSSTFESIAAMASAPRDWILDIDGEPRPVAQLQVTANLFSTLGVEPILGRDFEDSEDWRGQAPAMIIGHDLWLRDFGGDRGVIGRSVRLEGESYEVVGVMPAGFAYPEGVDLWRPMGLDPAVREQTWFRRAHWLRVVGRVKSELSLGEADAELQAIAARLEQQYPDTNSKMGVGTTPLREWIVGETRRPLTLLLGAILTVLLIACVNVLHLLLLRAHRRRHEMAVRSALGAAQRRLARQLFVESLALTAVAGALGWWVARVALGLLLPLAPDLPRLRAAMLDGGGVLEGAGMLDGRAAIFALVATVGTALLAGLLPALLGSRSGSGSVFGAVTLRSRAPSTGTRSIRSALVVSEVALALMLVLGAGLVVESFQRLHAVDPGFDPSGVLAVDINLPGGFYPEATDVGAFYDQLTARALALPGVDSVGSARDAPMDRKDWTSDFAIEGRAREDFGVEVRHMEVGDGYFETLGVPLLAGRLFDSRDHAEAPRAVLINRSLAEEYFPDQDPVGQKMTSDRYPDENSRWATIVGVVDDLRTDGLGLPARIHVYHDMRQRPQWDRTLFLRTESDPRSAIEPMRALVRDMDAQLPLMRVVPLEEMVFASAARERFLSWLLGAFAIVALLLALVGTWGVLAASVAESRIELGIRMALGANHAQVLGQVLRRGLVLVGLGIVLGSGLALAVSHQLQAILYDVSHLDPWVYALAASVVAISGLVAVYLPARRAARLDPMAVLRSE